MKAKATKKAPKKVPKRSKKREPHQVPVMTTEQIRDFVTRFCDGRIHTNHSVSANLLPHVFLPILFGAFEGWTKQELSQVGCLYGDTSKDCANSMSINGSPIFYSCSLMRPEDWERAKVAIKKELDRRENIDV